MPDHVHMIFTPLKDEQGNTYGLAEILKGIKGSSARSINKKLGRQGSVWQDESFDHVLRSDESIRAKVEYICQNPVRKKLAENEDAYPWLWREWVEGDSDPVTTG
jgi:REP element-mobilizing transposase RayT